MNLYRNESSNPKWNAQRNLEGRTHYVDDDTLRFHHARILTTAVTDGGLLFALVESYAADMNNTTRLFRPVIFDIDGNVIERNSLDEGFKTSKHATNAMWELLNNIDAVAVTNEAIERFQDNAAHEVAGMRRELQAVIDSGKVAA